MNYTVTTAAYCLEVEKAALEAIKDNMRRWRSKRHRSITTFHPDACAAMRELLPSLEEWKRTGTLPGGSSSVLLDDINGDGGRDRDEDGDRGGDRGRDRGRDRRSANSRGICAN